MSQPSVITTQLDGAIGVLPPSSGRLYALVGACSSGTANTPATYARVANLTSALGEGPLVEAAARHIQKTGSPVVVVKTAAATNVGAYGTLASTATGTSVVTVVTGTQPRDDYDFILTFVTGGTRGTAGATYKYSLDGGNNYSAVLALGTDTSVTTAVGNVGLAFGSGTFVAGDTHVVRTTAPRWDDTELLAALNALKASAVSWEMVYVVGDTGATSAGVIETWAQGLATAGKNRNWIANTRLPAAAESEATYLSSLNTAFLSFTTLFGTLCAGADDMISSVSGRNYRRPVAHVVGSQIASVSEEVDVSAINVGALAGVQIRDSAGNVRHHDESVNPGLDDARFTVLRTWDLEPGVFVNNPRIFSSTTSDFQFVQHRRVFNIALDAVQAFLRRRLSLPVRVNPATGFILEAEAREIELGAEAAVGAVLRPKPKASGWSVVLSRTDNILSTGTLTGDLRVVPLAYIKTITLTGGFSNPALAQATA